MCLVFHGFCHYFNVIFNSILSILRFHDGKNLIARGIPVKKWDASTSMSAALSRHSERT